MSGFLSRLFGKGKNTNTAATTDVPPYPSSMLQPKQEKDTAFGNAINAYVEKFSNSAEPDAGSDPEMKELYENTLTPQSRIMIFSNSYANMARVLNALSEKIPNDGLSRRDYLNKLQMFHISVFSRALIMEPAQLRESMVHRFSEMSEELAADCTAMSLAFLCLQNERIAGQILGRLELNSMVEEHAVKDTGIETKYQNDPQYGLVPGKPVFINGFGPHHIYLDALCTPDGTELKNDRRGSMAVDGINGMVDIYDLFLPNGKKYKTIYLCLYGQHNSMTAPRGLCFRAQS